MDTHRKRLARRWTLLAGSAVLVVGHGALLHYARSHLTVRTAAVSGVLVVLIAVKYLGLLGSLLGPLHAPRSRAGRHLPPSDEAPP